MFNTAGGGGIWRTQDGGFGWTQQATDAFTLPGGFPDAVYMFDENNGWALGDPTDGYFEIYTTTDGGDNWTRVPSADIPAPNTNEFGLTNSFETLGSTIWFGTYGGRVYKSTDMGYTWTVSDLGLSAVTDIAFINPDTGLAYNNGFVAGDPSLWRTVDGGTNWTEVTPTGNFHTYDLNSIPGSKDFISTGAGTGNGSSYSFDLGDSWVDIDNGVDHTGVDFYDLTTGWSGSTDDEMFMYAGIALGVNPQNNSNVTLTMYPNPASDHFLYSNGKLSFR
jgi:photosystem II stability/assembly factor-like uncharacterized protein